MGVCYMRVLLFGVRRMDGQLVDCGGEVTAVSAYLALSVSLWVALLGRVYL